MMKQSRPTILLTRPLPQSERFAREIAAQIGHVPVMISPLFQARFLQQPPRAAQGAVIFTSETGVAAAVAGGHVRADQIAYCVGSRTAQAAAQAGLNPLDAKGDWRDLALLIQSHCPRGPVTFFCAQDAPIHLEAALAGAGYVVARVEVYTQDILDLSAAARKVLRGDAPVILPLFSPKSAQVLAQHIPQKLAPLWLACISAACLSSFDAEYARSAIAHRPNAAALLDAIGNLLQ